MAKRGDFTGNPDGARQYLANLVASGEWTAVKPLDQYQDSQVMRKANTFKQQERAGVPIDNKASRGHADIIPTRPVPNIPSSSTSGPAPATQPSQPSVIGLFGRPTQGSLFGDHVPTLPTIPPTLPLIPPSAPTHAPKSRRDETIIHPPKIPLDSRIHGPRGSYQMATTRFKDVIKELKTIEKQHGAAKKVYFSLWDNRKGDWRKLYVTKGKSASKENNGVRVGDLLSRMRESVKGGGVTERESLIDSWEEDIDGGDAGGDTPGDVGLPAVFTVVSVHMMSS